MCPVDEALKKVQIEIEASDGKDVFSRDGLTQLKLIISDITGGKGQNGDIELLRDLCGVMGYQWLLDSMTEHNDEWDKHCRRKRCSAGICYEVVEIPFSAKKRRRRGEAN